MECRRIVRDGSVANDWYMGLSLQALAPLLTTHLLQQRPLLSTVSTEIYVQHCVFGSPAYRAGIRAGDVIMESTPDSVFDEAMAMGGIAVIIGTTNSHMTGGSDRRHHSACTASIALHIANAVLSLAEIVLGFVAAIMSCVGMTTPSNNIAPAVPYIQGPNMPPGQGGYAIIPIGRAEGIPQQQMFLAQQPHPTAVPVQGYYTGQPAPPYMAQSVNPGSGNGPTASSAGFNTQPSA